MKLSYLNWNTENPKFEDVRDRIILIDYAGCVLPAVDCIQTKAHYERVFNDDEFRRYAILSTDDSVCEYNHSENTTSCGWNENTAMTYCPHCGRPIKVITEPEVMELDGVKPEIKHNDHFWWAEYKNVTGMVFYQLQVETSPETAITAWNSFASKMKGG